jgi:hypothetical protein
MGSSSLLLLLLLLLRNGVCQRAGATYLPDIKPKQITNEHRRRVADLDRDNRYPAMHQWVAQLEADKRSNTFTFAGLAPLEPPGPGFDMFPAGVRHQQEQRAQAAGGRIGDPLARFTDLGKSAANRTQDQTQINQFGSTPKGRLFGAFRVIQLHTLGR